MVSLLAQSNPSQNYKAFILIIFIFCKILPFFVVDKKIPLSRGITTATVYLFLRN